MPVPNPLPRKAPVPKIEIDLDDLLGLKFDEDGEPVGRNNLQEEVVERAASALLDDCRREAKQRLAERIERVIDTEVTAVVREALAKPIQRRKPWGDPVGEHTSVLEIAREKLQEYFDKPGRRDSYDRSAANLTTLIDDVVQAALNTEFKPAVAEARAAVSERLREALTKVVASNVSQGR